MASTRTRNLARAIQRANPNMKYTEALRNAEAGRIVIDPKGPNDALIDLYRAAGMDVKQIPLSEGRRSLDPLQMPHTAPFELSWAMESMDTNSDFVPLKRAEGPLSGDGEKPGPVYDLSPSLWDGETHPDPLTFLVGHDLRTEEAHYLSLGGSTAHLLISGGTGTGKSSTAEVIAAQALVKPMPWDPTLFGTVMFVDPQGGLASRWAGRPGAIAAHGQMDAAEADESEHPVTGPFVMASALAWIESERRRRSRVLDKHGVASWMELPDEVKREERLAPVFVILDEYIDQANIDLADDAETAAWEGARRLALEAVRKGRTVGMHVVLVSTEVEAPALTPFSMATDMVRIMTGAVGKPRLHSAFGDQSVPELPVTRQVIEGKTQKTQRLPGRARIMEGTGQEISLIQVLRFGGNRNSETLDKWLPRGEAPGNGDFSLPSGKPRQGN